MLCKKKIYIYCPDDGCTRVLFWCLIHITFQNQNRKLQQQTEFLRHVPIYMKLFIDLIDELFCLRLANIYIRYWRPEIKSGKTSPTSQSTTGSNIMVWCQIAQTDGICPCSMGTHGIPANVTLDISWGPIRIHWASRYIQGNHSVDSSNEPHTSVLHRSL